jgi:glucose-1-phosphate thymidylyltransferase
VNVAGIIPAAGHAARVQPLHCSKEVYPIRGRPVMNHLIERMRAADCRDIRVVTRPDKLDVVQNARRQGTTVIEGHPHSLAASIHLGLGGLADRDVVLLGFPDTVWEPPDGYITLLAAVERGWDAALGLFPVPDPETCDVVLCDEHGRVVAIEPRPTNPASNTIWGCAAVRLDLMRGWDGATDPGVFFDSVAGSRRITGIRLSDEFVDIGKSRRVVREAAEQP